MREFNIKNYGAIGDAETLNTVSIQKAIDECAEHGGGRVVIGEGTYLSGTICLRSNVELHIEADGCLLGSSDCNDFPERNDVVHVESYNLPRHRNACFIFAERCENISITGMGTIDCNGSCFVEKKGEDWTGWEYQRLDLPTPPRVVFFTGCKNVRIENITMQNQPSGWSYWIHDCDFVSFDKCKILANVQYPNNDGIHINSSRNVTVSNCDINCGDDCIIVRANNLSLPENKVCERVTVVNCNLTSYANGIRIGWMGDGVIRNCTFSNIVMTDTVTGIGISLPRFNAEVPDHGREDSVIENLSFNNIIMDDIYAHPVKITLSPSEYSRCKAVQNIFFSNIHARGLEFPYIHGNKDYVIKNIHFTDCSFVKVAESVLPDYKKHGPAAWGRKIDAPIVKLAENVVFNNTTFTAD
ncbi:MAG: hypothetical protein IKA82_01170 [Clostridia bacterium]|nr:hypothetical protein [Clostridia bacterium]